MIDLEADEGALDDGQLALVVLPGGAAGELLVQPRPRPCAVAVPYREVSVTVTTAGSGQVAGSLRPSLRPVPGRPAVRARLARRGREVHDPVRAQPPGDVHGQAVQQPGQPGQVVAGVEDDDDVRVAVASSARPR